MYDWPQVREETDYLWQSFRQVLLNNGYDVERQLDRTQKPLDLWLDSRLIFSQTCGLPFVSKLQSSVGLWGTPEYAVAGFTGSRYASQVVVRRSESRRHLSDFANSRFAYNGPDSQSGFNAMKMMLRERIPGKTLSWFTLGEASGSHAESLAAVASGACDICCVDPVSWQLAIDHLSPITDELSVIDQTPATAGLPYVYSLNRESEPQSPHTQTHKVRLNRVRDQLQHCIRHLPDEVTRALYLVDLHPTSADDYDGIAESLTVMKTGDQ